MHAQCTVIAGAGGGYLPVRAAPAAEPGARAENASRLHLGKDPLRRRRKCHLATSMSLLVNVKLIFSVRRQFS